MARALNSAATHRQSDCDCDVRADVTAAPAATSTAASAARSPWGQRKSANYKRKKTSKQKGKHNEHKSQDLKNQSDAL